MRYIYHYYALCRITRDREVMVDGILNRKNPIRTMEDYRESKDCIRDTLLTKDPSIVVIVQSLSLLEAAEDHD